jgi:hypothetical protein
VADLLAELRKLSTEFKPRPEHPEPADQWDAGWDAGERHVCEKLASILDAAPAPPEEVERRLGEIEAREKAATKGPWQNYYNRHAVFQSLAPYPQTDRVRDVAQAQTHADGDFIAHARQDIPWLVAQLRARLASPASPPQELERLREKRLADIYKRFPLAVAEVCDEVLDRSGALLGRIRAAARSPSPATTREGE